MREDRYSEESWMVRGAPIIAIILLAIAINFAALWVVAS